MTTDEPCRVDLTAAAADLLRRLAGRHGPLMFHQSGGCCDGSSPMCFPDGEFQTGEADIRLGELPVPGLDRPVPFWMSRSQYGQPDVSHGTSVRSGHVRFTFVAR